jgi:hypothetical protein
MSSGHSNSSSTLRVSCCGQWSTVLGIQWLLWCMNKERLHLCYTNMELIADKNVLQVATVTDVCMF